MQIGSSPIWTRRNEIWWRRRTWRTEDRESAALAFVGGGKLEARGESRGRSCGPAGGARFRRTSSAESFAVWPLEWFAPARECVEVFAGCNAVRSRSLVGGGIKSRAEGCSPLTIPTRCRGSAAESAERARSCRCRRAGRKPGTTTAECSSSTTTPGKLHGLTPEIGMPQGLGAVGARTHAHTHIHTYTHAHAWAKV